MDFQIRTHQEIEALPDNEVKKLYEQAKRHLLKLQEKVEQDGSLINKLLGEIQATIRNYVWLRGRKFPDYFED